MAREIPYDVSRNSLYKPGLAEDFFKDWGPVSDAALCAEMSRLAYCDGPKISDNLGAAGFELTRDPFESESTFAFLARNQQTFVLAFRGSEGDDPKDVIDDALILLKPWKDMGKVHHGFARALERVWDDVAVALEDTGGARLLITGRALKCSTWLE